MKKTSCVFFALLLFFNAIINAQPVESTGKTPVQFKLGMFYSAHVNYYGRTDILRSNSFFPLAEVWLSPNFYVNGAPIFTSNAVNVARYAGTVVTAGYQKKSSNEKFFSHTFITKPFYSSDAPFVQSSLKIQLSSSLSWNNGLFSLTGGADLKYSDKLDYGLSASIDHLFKQELSHGLLLAIDPTVSLNAGTQQFAKTYYEKKNVLLLPLPDQVTTRQVQSLAILSYDISSTVMLNINKLQLLFIPGYVVPQNLVTVEDHPELSEVGSSAFYVTVGAKWTF